MTKSKIPPLMLYCPKKGIRSPFPSEALQYRLYHGSAVWRYNPYTGTKRHKADIESDPTGLLIVVDSVKQATKVDSVYNIYALNHKNSPYYRLISDTRNATPFSLTGAVLTHMRDISKGTNRIHRDKIRAWLIEHREELTRDNWVIEKLYSGSDKAEATRFMINYSDKRSKFYLLNSQLKAGR